ncbi:hypothetical protein A3D03_06240 [Candidatus Gottesmanbacteria bacterium RIFCSPHIGHO2_02_FULL_40_13]|uniref:Glycosyltransferase RgtA/B/C/D-like domain-containing protein n=1 Tax=Candidatus Gottesmanbacteria bacterium RIFCSPHIGHO2_02_FULL_40_13 TaxID=1798384 RepID=A0A1F6A5N4_9BACT|nr:MAG: hypothetical protein A3D03_06240 [Candidatus Gottesmanbacteria bacterium RIFCSPHIGHO2_02_FULL_40_13]
MRFLINKLFKLISGYFLVYFFIAQLYFFLANLPLLINIIRTSKDTFFPLFHSANHYDYNMYLSVITQGAKGLWLAQDPYTSEITNPSLFYFFYILIGKMAALFNLPSYIAYHIIRIISTELFIMLLYVMNKTVLGVKIGFWASLFGIIATISPVFLFNQTGAFETFFLWWGGYEALKRLDNMPHYLFSFACLFLIITLLVKYLNSKSVKYFLISLPIIFLSGIILPPSILPILLTIPAACYYLFMLNTRDRKRIIFSSNDLLAFLILISVTLSPLLLIWRENYNGFPWDTWNKWEIATWNLNEPNFNRALVLLFGFLPVLSIPAIIKIIKSRDFTNIFIIFWALMPYLFLPFVNLLGFSKMRLVSSSPFTPFAMIAAYSLFGTEFFVKKRFLQITTLTFFLLYSFYISGMQLYLQLKNEVVSPMYTSIFIPNTSWYGIYFLAKTAPKNSIVLSNEFIGSLIPAYSFTKTYFAHSVHTKDFQIKQGLVAKFYSNHMPEKEAYNFIKNNNINYIYYGPDEMSLGDPPLSYTFLEKAYENKDVTVFKVKNNI